MKINNEELYKELMDIKKVTYFSLILSFAVAAFIIGIMIKYLLF